jgi:hypothetical protein
MDPITLIKGLKLLSIFCTYSYLFIFSRIILIKKKIQKKNRKNKIKRKINNCFIKNIILLKFKITNISNFFPNNKVKNYYFNIIMMLDNIRNKSI